VLGTSLGVSRFQSDIVFCTRDISEREQEFKKEVLEDSFLEGKGSSLAALASCGLHGP